MQVFSPEPILPAYTSRPDHVERALKTRYQDAMAILHPQGKELDLLIVILPDNNGSLYGKEVSYFFFFLFESLWYGEPLLQLKEIRPCSLC